MFDRSDDAAILALHSLEMNVTCCFYNRYHVTPNGHVPQILLVNQLQSKPMMIYVYTDEISRKYIILRLFVVSMT